MPCESLTPGSRVTVCLRPSGRAGVYDRYSGVSTNMPLSPAQVAQLGGKPHGPLLAKAFLVPLTLDSAGLLLSSHTAFQALGPYLPQQSAPPGEQAPVFFLTLDSGH